MSLSLFTAMIATIVLDLQLVRFDRSQTRWPDFPLSCLRVSDVTEFVTRSFPGVSGLAMSYESRTCQSYMRDSNPLIEAGSSLIKKLDHRG